MCTYPGKKSMKSTYISNFGLKGVDTDPMEEMFLKDTGKFESGLYETTYSKKLGGNIKYAYNLIAYLMYSPQCADTLHIGRGNVTYNAQFGYLYNRKVAYEKLKMCSICLISIVKGEERRECVDCLAWDCRDNTYGLLDEDGPSNLPLDSSILNCTGKLPCCKMTLL